MVSKKKIKKIAEELTNILYDENLKAEYINRIRDAEIMIDTYLDDSNLKSKFYNLMSTLKQLLEDDEYYFLWNYIENFEDLYPHLLIHSGVALSDDELNIISRLYRSLKIKHKLIWLFYLF